MDCNSVTAHPNAVHLGDRVNFLNFGESFAALYEGLPLSDSNRKDIRDTYWEPLVREEYRRRDEPARMIQVGGGRSVLGVPRDVHERIIRQAVGQWSTAVMTSVRAFAQPTVASLHSSNSEVAERHEGPATQLKLRKFDPSTIRNNCISVVIGKRNTGKSVLARDIVYHKRTLPAGMASRVPELFIFDEFDVGAVERLIQRQREMSRRGTPTPVIMVLDNCALDKQFTKHKCIRQIFMNGRHWKISLLLTAQYCGDLGPEIRCNIDYVFILRDNIASSRERLYRNFFAAIPSFDTFCQLMRAATENHECLVVDNTSRSNNLEDCLYWYKADRLQVR